MKSNIQDLIQYIVVNTSFPPLTYLYKMFYNLSIAVAVLFLRQVDGVVAIYLRRGAAKGEIIYGLSDIDLLVLVKDEEDDQKGQLTKERVRATYDRLSRFIPLLGSGDRELGVYSASEFLGLYNDHDFYRYRFHSGTYTWKLLYGRDVVKALPQIEETQLYLPATEELKVWWALLNVEFTTDCSSPLFKRKYLWYKAISEAARVYLFVCCSRNILSREAALCEIKNYLPNEHHWHIDRIRDYPKQLNSKEDLTSNELLKLFITLGNETYREMESKVYGDEKGRMAILHIPCSNELIVNPNLANLLKKLDISIRDELEPYLEQIALIPQVEFDVDILNNSDIDSFHLVLVQKNLIPVETLKKVHSLLGQSLHPQNIEPFMVVDGRIAFSLQLNRPHHCIKSLKTSPLFFSLLSTSTPRLLENSLEEFSRDIHCYLPPDTFVKTIRKRAAKIDVIISDKNVYKVKTLDLLKFFWAAARTKLLVRSLETDGIHIPLTSRQILDMLLKSFPEDSEWLNRLYIEYIKELRGEENESYRFFSKALELLNRI